MDIADKDPHTPRQFGQSRLAILTVGLWWASMGWKFDRNFTAKKIYAGQLIDEPLLKWFDKNFVLISYSGLLLPFLFGFAIEGYELGIKWFSYFGAFRVFVGYFFTEFIVNGLCHAAGSFSPAPRRSGRIRTNRSNLDSRSIIEKINSAQNKWETKQ